MNLKRMTKSSQTVPAAKPKRVFESVEEELRLRNSSPKTTQVYPGQLGAFVGFFMPRHPR